MSASDYGSLVAQAEGAVKSVKDAELRRLAFQKILDELLSSSEIRPKKSSKRTVATGNVKGKAKQGPIAYVRELSEDDFFKKPKSIAQVKMELENRGHHIAVTSLSGPLQKLCQSRVLRRQRGKGGNDKGVFTYTDGMLVRLRFLTMEHLMKGKKLSPDIEALNDVLEALGRLSESDARRWVLETASNRLGISLPDQTETLRIGAGSLNKPEKISTLTPKEFIRAKAPKSDVQRVACLAFYLTHARSTPHFRIVDLGSLNTEAAGPNMNMTRATDNATRKNNYLAAGEGDRSK